MSETPPDPPPHDRSQGPSGPQPGLGPGGADGPSGPQPPVPPVPQFAPPAPPPAGPYSAPPAGFPPPGSAQPPVVPGPHGYAPGGVQGPAAAPPPPDGSTGAMVAHLVGVVFACVGWLPALIVYLTLKDRSPFARHHAAEALNLQLTLFVPYVVGAGLFAGYGFFSPDLAWIGSAVVVAVWLVSLVFGVLAATAAARDAWYRYPIAVHLVK